MSSPEPSSLTELFREYYAQVAACHLGLEGDDGELTLDSAQEPLLASLAKLEAGAEDRFATDSVSLKQARYLLACFADDQLGRGDGPKAAAWRAATLESKLYQTDEGEIEIFRRIDKLLEVGDPGRRDLAGAYLLALALGFRGRIEGSAGERALRDYRQRLLSLAAPDRQGDQAVRGITPSAYRHTLGQSAVARLPSLSRWSWIALGALSLLLLVSYLIFAEETTAVAAIVERILDRSQTR